MEKIQEIIIRKNFRNVATIIDKHGNVEELSDGKPDIQEVIKGVADLNKTGIVIYDIQTGISREGVTKIRNSHDTFGLYVNHEWVYTPNTAIPSLPEVNFLPFKSDSWILGEFIVKEKTGKYIPKRFLKSQKLLDTFSGDDEILKKLLVLDPSQRAYSWELVKEEQSGCIIS